MKTQPKQRPATKPQAVKKAPPQPRHCFEKIMQGVVDNVTGSAVSVMSETPEGPFQAQYDPAKFTPGKIPNEGDNITVSIRLFAKKPVLKDFKSTLPSFAKLTTKGPIQL